ncbi:MAG: site-2 protease family protein [Candidatus Omnitrophica bacterium]|nr:site-2 protease family protein [Candidatus Omnitrophota bacterium]MBD3269875.1 site-2 protease family protein [Candidatus Omnitrophota bacterium]
MQLLAVLLIILFLSIPFHEYAHGWAAFQLGDTTPKNSGRLTLNPLAHIDMVGTIILPILLAIISLRTLGLPIAIGYAKPVPINPYHFKNPHKDIKWVSLAGPASNLLLAVVFSLGVRMSSGGLEEIFFWAMYLNLILAVFNLVPIPPLDGSKILASLLPSKIAQRYLKIEPYGLFIIIILMALGFFHWFILPLVTIFIHLFGLGTEI